MFIKFLEFLQIVIIIEKYGKSQVVLIPQQCFTARKTAKPWLCTRQVVCTPPDCMHHSSLSSKLLVYVVVRLWGNSSDSSAELVACGT